MSMYNLIRYTALLLSLTCVWSYSVAQKATEEPTTQIKGMILDSDDLSPLENAQIGSPEGVRAVVSGPKGRFQIRVYNPNALVSVTKEGYFTEQVELFGRDSIVVYLRSVAATMATDQYSTPDGTKAINSKYSSASALNTRTIGKGYYNTSDALTGRFSGLRILNKSGMHGEGSFINLRGNRTLLGENTPLIVVDGIPYLPDQRLSNIINGFSTDILNPVNLKEVEQITLLKGVDALAYGSMGSNGVLMIETEKGLDNQTRVEFQTVEGVSFINKTIPLMNSVDFRKYISDIGSSRYADPKDLQTFFPFLGSNLSEVQKARYGFNSDWQKEIYTPAFNSENMLKVKGGDAVVKFLLTAGYQSNNGILDGTTQSKFNTRGNTNIAFSDKLTANASVAFDFLEMNLQEQGMSPQTNPMLAAYGYSPLSGKYEIEDSGRTFVDLSKVDPAMGVSNPIAIKSGIEAKNKIYDMLINMGINYKLNNHWKFNIAFGIYYNYIKDDIFIGGKSSGAIAPLMGGLAENSVRSGSAETKNYYAKAGIGYSKTFATKHNVEATLAWQLMSTRQDASSGSGINTTSDRYRNLTNVNNSVGRSSAGYSDIWNWMNAYLSANYTFDHQILVGATAMVDAASTYGEYSGRYFLFPGVKAGWKINNAPFLRDNGSISNLMLRAEYSINPNSRYNSRYGKYYYVLQMLRDVSGLVRNGIPNGKIGPERVSNMNVGADFATIGDKFTVSLDIFEENTRKMIIENESSSAYGFNHIYKNNGSMRSRGVELNMSALITGGAFRWRVGANISHYKSKITSLGDMSEQKITLDDGVTLINRVGESPFSFYGHRSEGVFETSAEANASALTTISGYTFGGGDIQFHDQNNDGVITDADRQILGNADPKLFGGVHSLMSYKGFSLFVNLTYSYGNDIYNGVRRYNESGNKFTNQAKSMSRRWLVEGQQTDVPRVTFGDQAGNNRFSSRWIEDGSFIKMKEVRLSYEINRRVLFLTGLKVFVSGENLFTFTKYKGSDPEFSYSYDMGLQGMDLGKVPVPRFVKLGVIMNF